MNKLILCMLLGVVTLKGFGQEKLSKIKLEKELEVKIPASFSPLNGEEVARKYLSNSTPLMIYGNERRTADFGVSKNQTRWTARDTEILKDFYKASILSTYTSVNFLKEEIIDIGDQKFILFEFISVFKEEDKETLTGSSSVNKYTYLLYGLRNGNLYVFNFSAGANEKDYWRATVDKMMQSIKFL